MEIATLQRQFQHRIQDEGEWFYDLADCTLRIGNQSFPITPIGTHSTEHRSWLWGWANEEFPPHARDAARHLQSLHTLTGFRVFLSPGIGASASDAQDFVALAVHYLGAIGYFRVPAEGPTLFLAVHQPSDSDARSA
jgi:hypothetical protein